eukprot:5473236-Lingulodinium_polyedra.AAC.1
MEPDLIIHECTKTFNPDIFDQVFNGMYLMGSVTFSPTDLGVPAARPRRYTVLFHRNKLFPLCPYNEIHFKAKFCRVQRLRGDVYFQASDEDISAYMKELAREKMIDLDDGYFHMRDLLPASRYQ